MHNESLMKNKKKIIPLVLGIFVIATLAIAINFSSVDAQNTPGGNQNSITNMSGYNISAETDYGISENTVYVTVEDNTNSKKDVNVTFTYNDGNKTQQLGHEDMKYEANVTEPVFGLVNNSLGKYDSKSSYQKNGTTYYNYTDTSNDLLCQGRDINGSEELLGCDYILSDKTVFVEERGQVGTKEVVDWVDINSSQAISKENTANKIQFKNGYLPLGKAKNTNEIKLKVKVDHPIFTGDYEVPEEQNKYNITATSADGVYTTTLDPTWWNSTYDLRYPHNDNSSGYTGIGYFGANKSGFYATIGGDSQTGNVSTYNDTDTGDLAVANETTSLCRFQTETENFYCPKLTGSAEGLVSYYTLDDNDTSSNARDYIGGNDGTWNGNLPTQTTGQVGNAQDFDGSGDYVNLGTDEFQFGGNDFTYSAWVNGDSLSDGDNDRIIVTHGGRQGIDNTGSGNLRFTCSGPASLSFSASNNNWYHVVGVKSSTDGMKLFVNGNLEGSDASATGSCDLISGETWIGGNSFENKHYFDGQIDDVRIYNRSLSSTEVSNLYQSTNQNFPYWGQEEPLSTLSIDLQNPQDNLETTDLTHDFVANASSDSNNIENMTLYIYNSTGLEYENTTQNPQNSTNMTLDETITLNNFDNYQWYVSATNNDSTTTSSENRSLTTFEGLDVGNLTDADKYLVGDMTNLTQVVTPGSNNEPQYVNFTLTSPTGTRKIDNINGTILNNTHWRSGNATLDENGTWVANTSIEDEFGNVHTREINFDVTTIPIEQISPEDEANLTGVNQTFEVNVSEMVPPKDIENMTIYIYNSTGFFLNETFANPTNSPSMSLTEEINIGSVGDYQWYAEATNNQSSTNQTSNRSFSIKSNFTMESLNSTNTSLAENTRINLSVDEGENNIAQYARFNLTAPSGYKALESSNGTRQGNGSYWLSDQVRLNETGIWNTSAVLEDEYGDKYNITNQFNVTYNLERNPESLLFAAKNESDEVNQFNITLYDDSNGTINYDVSSAIENSSQFNISETDKTEIELNSSDNSSNPVIVTYTVQALDTITNGTYSGNITFSNTSFSQNYITSFNYSINPPAGEPVAYDSVGGTKCDSDSDDICANEFSGTQGDSFSDDYAIQNDGFADIDFCSVELTSDFQNENFYSFNVSTFNLSQGESIPIELTMNTGANTIPSDYRGNLNVVCEETDLLDNPGELSPSNRPYVRLNLEAAEDDDDQNDTDDGGGSGPGGPSENDTQWSMETSTGGSRYTVIKVPGASVSNDLVFENQGDSSRSIALRCEDVNGNLCAKINFEEDEFVLPLSEDISISRSFTINFPTELSPQNEVANIIAEDEIGNEGVITVETTQQGFLSEYLAKLGSQSELFGIPFWLILVISLLLIWIILASTLLRNNAGISFLIALVASGIIVAVI